MTKRLHDSVPVTLVNVRGSRVIKPLREFISRVVLVDLENKVVDVLDALVHRLLEINHELQTTYVARD